MQDHGRQLTRETARPGQVVQVFANNWKEFGFLVEWTPESITVRHANREKPAVRPAREVNAVFAL